jgi:hypothetical protein
MSNWPQYTTKGDAMTNKELADKLGTSRLLKGMTVRDLENIEEAARRLRELPDPTPSEPEYGMEDLADDLGMLGSFQSVLHDWDAEYACDLLRGTCVRLMREKGWELTHIGQIGSKQSAWWWGYGIDFGGNPNGCDTAHSEPAAYRDMLKHAGVIQ